MSGETLVRRDPGPRPGCSGFKGPGGEQSARGSQHRVWEGDEGGGELAPAAASLCILYRRTAHPGTMHTPSAAQRLLTRCTAGGQARRGTAHTARPAPSRRAGSVLGLEPCTAGTTACAPRSASPSFVGPAAGRLPAVTALLGVVTGTPLSPAHCAWLFAFYSYRFVAISLIWLSVIPFYLLWV